MKMYIPYYFDLQYEFETYKNIGKAHKIDYLSKTRLFYKFKKVIRNCANINETKYKNIDEYSVWKRYIKNNSTRCVCIMNQLFQYLIKNRYIYI